MTSPENDVSGYVRPVNRSKDTPTHVSRVYDRFKWAGRILLAGSSFFAAAGLNNEDLRAILWLIAAVLFLPVLIIFAPTIFHAMYRHAQKRLFFVICCVIIFAVATFLYNTHGSYWCLIVALVAVGLASTVSIGFAFIECKQELFDDESPT